MGGHTQYGDFDTLEEAVQAWDDTIAKASGEWGLFLRAGSITYDSSHGKYKLAMRFTK